MFNKPNTGGTRLFGNPSSIGNLFGNNLKNVNLAPGNDVVDTNTETFKFGKPIGNIDHANTLGTTGTNFSFSPVGFSFGNTGTTDENTGSLVTETKTANIPSFSFGNTGTTTTNKNTGSLFNGVKTSNISSDFGYGLSLDTTTKNTGSTNNNTDLFTNKNQRNSKRLSFSNKLNRPAVTSMFGNPTSRGEVKMFDNGNHSTLAYI